MNEVHQFKNFEIHPFDFSNGFLVDEALDLLNAETLNKKHNRAFWDWKFTNNPFGSSVGWYAREKKTKKLAGILLWWPWKFWIHDQGVLFYQAINGKTDSKYRNSGIFLELNRIAIDFFNKGNSFLYGVPNNQSYPSYVKLGWETISTLNPVYLATSPFHTFLKVININKKAKHTQTNIDLNNLNFELDNAEQDLLFTKWNHSLIEWRFLKHPSNFYSFYRYKENFIVYKINQQGRFLEARIVMTSIAKTFKLKHLFHHLAGENIDFISYYGCNTLFFDKINNQVNKYRIKRSRLFLVLNKHLAHNTSFQFELAATDSQ